MDKFKSAEVVTVRFSPERKAELQALAQRWGLKGKLGAPNVSAAVRKLVDKGLQACAVEHRG